MIMFKHLHSILQITLFDSTVFNIFYQLTVIFKILYSEQIHFMMSSKDSSDLEIILFKAFAF